MTAIQRVLAIAAIALSLPTSALAAQTDPEVILYRFPGVRDDGGIGNVGVATVFHCTNFSGVPENVRYVVRDADTTIRANVVVVVNHLVTHTASTHVTAAYANEFSLTTNTVAQGTMAIAATSPNIICTGETIDASTAAPVGVARRGIRFSPVPGTQE
jgi:hypothetical protein